VTDGSRQFFLQGSWDGRLAERGDREREIKGGLTETREVRESWGGGETGGRLWRGRVGGLSPVGWVVTGRVWPGDGRSITKRIGVLEGYEVPPDRKGIYGSTSTKPPKRSV